MLIEFSNVETLGLAAIFLVIGHFIKERIPVLERYFIPSPIIGGLVFSIIMLIGHQTGAFNLELSNDMRDLLLMMFFTTIGFTASLEMLKRGGVAVRSEERRVGKECGWGRWREREEEGEGN